MMMEGTILPDLRARAGTASVIRSRTLRTWGMSESGLAEVLSDRIDALDVSGHATLAFQASGIEGLKVRITAKSDDEQTAAAILDQEEALIRPILGSVIFGIDDETMEVAVLKQLQAQGLTLAAVETLTGGVLASRMTAADPSMATFRGGQVLADADAALADTEAQARAIDQAEQARKVFGAHVGLAAVAPLASEEQRPGTVVMVASIAGDWVVETTILQPDRNRMRNYGVISVLDFLRKTLAG